MKNLLLYHKNKGKVYPSPSLRPSSSNNNNNKKDDVLSLLLPAAVLVQLVSVLSLEDLEVLSYLLTMSYHQKKATSHDLVKPLFDCGCFDCYTSFWSRWDSSPNRQLIHQVIEAFELHLSKREQHDISSSSSKNRAAGKNKKKKKLVGKEAEIVIPEEIKPLVAITEDSIVVLCEECVNEEEKATVVTEETEEQETVVVAEETEEHVQVVNNNGGGGVARMVLPDLLGILNSCLWSLWVPN
ncbi:hypothetical protein MKW94_024890 [Papaver nudicaule]|uniref:Uncharacterized protein n=1 Tax=Papaver nudicaule TaxID=74823 RepID=A0AA41VQA3_PAPNU|nr:hypothetical protein [Papaver nudicaule]